MIKNYTVILLYPDYMTDNFGQETWMDSVEAESVNEAITKGRRRLLTDNQSGAEMEARQRLLGGAETEAELEAELENSLDDLFVIAVMEGLHNDVKSQVCAVQA